MSLVPPGNSNYYELLEISPTASPLEIHAAYSKARATYSPDSPALYSMFTPEEARELMKLIEEAYSVLSNQSKRQSYDLALARKGQVKPPAASKPKPATERERRGEWFKQPVPAPPPSRDSLPDGFARTRFGNYEVDPNLEAEMENLEECSGEFLKRVRLYKKVPLDQLSNFIRVSKSNIGALEADAFDALPAAVFVRGFVVQICRAMNLNEKTVVDAYMKYYRKNTSG